MSPDASSPSSPPVRWWPAALISVVAVVALAATWLRESSARQPQVLATIFILVLASAALFLWATLFSRLRGRVRLGIFVGAIAAVVLFLGLFEIEGVSGDLIPIVSFKFAGDRDFADVIAPDQAGAATASPTDFPQYHGPQRDGVIRTVQLARDWEANPPQEIWRNPVGDAWSSFVVVGEAAITQEQRGDEELVVRYDLATGKTVWTHADASRYGTALGGVGPRATPTVHGGVVYTMGANGIVNALSLDDGSVIWSRDVLEETGADLPEWGKSNSPLIHENLVIVAAGGNAGKSLIAYDRATGDEVWSGGSGLSSYASPVFATLGGTPQILNLNHLSFDSHDPSTGEVLWSMPWENQTPTAAQPLVLDDERVLISAGYGHGSHMYRVAAGAAEPELLWDSKRLKSKFASMVLHEGTIYGLDDGIMIAIDPETGDRLWKRGRYGHGQILLVDDLLLIQAENGDVVLVEPNPEKLIELGRFTALNDKTWNPLALSGKYLLVRNHREAACYELPLV